jgi:hypothetical protein
LKKHGIEGDADDFIERHKEPEHHKNLDTFYDQMGALKKAGFVDVDCFYKFGIFTMYGVRK